MWISGNRHFPSVSNLVNSFMWLFFVAVVNLYTHANHRPFLHQLIHICWGQAAMASESSKGLKLKIAYLSSF
jgi:hypothetical protein